MSPRFPKSGAPQNGYQPLLTIADICGASYWAAVLGLNRRGGRVPFVRAVLGQQVT